MLSSNVNSVITIFFIKSNTNHFLESLATHLDQCLITGMTRGNGSMMSQTYIMAMTSHTTYFMAMTSHTSTVA